MLDLDPSAEEIKEAELLRDFYLERVKQMRLKEGMYYSYRVADGARQVFRFDGVTIERSYWDTPTNVSVIFFGQDPVDGSFRDRGRTTIEIVQYVHGACGLRKAEKREMRRFRKHRAKCLLSQ